MEHDPKKPEREEGNTGLSVRVKGSVTKVNVTDRDGNWVTGGAGID